MNRRIEQLEEALQDEYEKEYQRLLKEDWEHWQRTGKRKYEKPEVTETWEYKGDTY